MAKCDDPLRRPTPPDRLAYTTGALLDADDFKDEQTYHRARLARALASFYGSGTLSGLKVKVVSGAAAPDGEESLRVEPGLALDRLGRIIEVPRAACIRLKRWYDAINPTKQPIVTHGTAPNIYTVADLFIRFVECERGMTPAFRAGPFDALDAVGPSRLRDSYDLRLFLRNEDLGDKLPKNVWPDLHGIVDPADRKTKLAGGILDGLEKGRTWDEDGKLIPVREHVAGQDATFLFLARITIPLTPAAAGAKPTWKGGLTTLDINNDSRPFVTPGERWISETV
jgi:hypothetical protein